MVEGLLFWLDLALMMYFCWRIIKLTKGEAKDLGIFSFKDTEKKP
ncbi:hypothetical protein [Rhodoferax antarcticus]|uniref:Uncharacterized protein n=1 Tax=Rhodoferax antarcticus ANT.BR TaxID=1111071 RepID=A0A1Q8YGX0_9BURK|nr:hypothetical protein [Rhodoferax antarcticus]OLP07311.1 hypothetical protein BLL52_1141 [Rhodoferax antarcticus ANT.BR]